MRQLYNVGWVLGSTPSGSLTLGSLGPTAGPAWFCILSQLFNVGWVLASASSGSLVL